MITQQLIDYIVQDIAYLWSLIPALPSGLASTFTNVTDFEFWMRGHLQVFGPLIPWGEFESFAAVYIATLGVWAVVLSIRGLLWVINR